MAYQLLIIIADVYIVSFWNNSGNADIIDEIHALGRQWLA